MIKFEESRTMSYTLDQELNSYWQKLTTMQKKSVIDIVKSLVSPPAKPSETDQYNSEISAAMERMDRGGYLNHDDVESEAAEW